MNTPPTETPQEETPAPVFKRPIGRPRRRSPRGRRYHPVTVFMDTELVAAIDTEAERLEMASRSDLIRKAAMDYLRRQEKRRSRAEGCETE